MERRKTRKAADPIAALERGDEQLRRAAVKAVKYATKQIPQERLLSFLLELKGLLTRYSDAERGQDAPEGAASSNRAAMGREDGGMR